MTAARHIVLVLGAVAALGLHAMDASMLLAGTRTDPSRMRLWKSDSVNLFASFMDGGEQAATAVVWVRTRRPTGMPMSQFVSFWSVDPARATREGGPELPAIKEYAPVAATSGGTFANPNYDDRGLGGRWVYGCYVVNVQTDVPLTLTIAGAEKQIAASNGVKQVFNIQGAAADWSWSLSGASSGNVSFGFGTNPLVQFYGSPVQIANEGYGMVARGGTICASGITNEWFMCAYRLRFDGAGHVIERQAGFSWDAEWFPPGEGTNETVRTSFAKDARIAVDLYSTAITDVQQGVERYGVKVFPQWLTDDQLRNVRDLDMFEMQRRGFTRWRND